MKDGVVHVEQVMVVLGLGIGTRAEGFESRFVPGFVIGVVFRFEVVLDTDNEGLGVAGNNGDQ